jgi:hypothetical protein
MISISYKTIREALRAFKGVQSEGNGAITMMFGDISAAVGSHFSKAG